MTLYQLCETKEAQCNPLFPALTLAVGSGSEPAIPRIPSVSGAAPSPPSLRGLIQLAIPDTRNAPQRILVEPLLDRLLPPRINSCHHMFPHGFQHLFAGAPQVHHKHLWEPVVVVENRLLEATLSFGIQVFVHDDDYSGLFLAGHALDKSHAGTTPNAWNQAMIFFAKSIFDLFMCRAVLVALLEISMICDHHPELRAGVDGSGVHEPVWCCGLPLGWSWIRASDPAPSHIPAHSMASLSEAKFVTNPDGSEEQAKTKPAAWLQSLRRS